MAEDFSTSPVGPSESKRIQKQEEALARRLDRAQVNSERAMTQYADEAAFNPVMMAKRFQSLEERMRKGEIEKKEDEEFAIVEQIEEISKEFEKKNPELTARSLQLLLSQIKDSDTAEEILRKAMKSHPDYSLADESLEFLEQATKGDIQAKIQEAKENLNTTYGREIRAGRNMATQAREFSQAGLGSPTGLRDLYRDITGNPRDTTTLFNEMHDQFSYEKLNTAIDFLLHSLGADLKSKGPSIAPGELHRLMTESRNLLAILWVYRFFKGRMDLINSSFERGGMLLPARVTFEMLAKMFVQFLMERYPSMDKVFQLALKMGISHDVLAQIILFTQMRDAVRGVAPKMFRTEQHRHDVLMSFIEALEELEEQEEEEEEEEEEKEE